MKIKYLPLLFLLFSYKSQDINSYQFDPRILKQKETYLSEIADDINYAPLDKTLTLDIIPKFKIKNGYIYLASRGIGLVKYNLEGKFINRIGSIGKGPGEYLLFNNFTIDGKSGNVYNLDINGIVKVYSSTGRFVRKFSLSTYADMYENIEYFNSLLFVQCAIQFTNASYEWIFTDTLGKVIIKKSRHLPSFTANWGGSEPVFLLENKLSYFNMFTDTVFSISPSLNENSSIIISPGEHRLPKANLPPDQFMSDKYLYIDKILETKRFFMIRYRYHEALLALIDKKEKKSYSINLKAENRTYQKGIINDLDGGHFFIPEEYYTDGDREYLIELINPIQIQNNMAELGANLSVPKYPDKKKQLEKLANSLKETDNQVLMIVKLKK